MSRKGWPKDWWLTSHWGVEYPGTARRGPHVAPWPNEEEARERAGREPAVRLMRKNDSGAWVPAPTTDDAGRH